MQLSATLMSETRDARTSLANGPRPTWERSSAPRQDDYKVLTSQEEAALVRRALKDALPELAEKGNPNAVSDVGAASLLLDACVEGALLNVGINLSSIDDAAFVAEMQRETAILQEESQRLRSQVLALVRKRF